VVVAQIVDSVDACAHHNALAAALTPMSGINDNLPAWQFGGERASP
jgi:hypothetical protein